LLAALFSAVLLGAVNTFGDFLWAGLSLRHRMAYGLVHGAIICLCIGALVGWRARQPVTGIATGPVIGLLAAGVFYLLAPWFRYYAMFPAWMFFWICFAVLQRFLTRERAWGPAIARGLVAAIVSGLVFYAISGIWTRPPPGGPNYLYNFGAWVAAFFPGFAALFTAAPARATAASGSNARDSRLS
jgi:hypothetical protein